ncbi:hypothetical protein MUP77_05755, partial [Candidatus Bathyarchaeota archaeon]|nr:hypothetical protein [Candidatus Bathyarchaeota archaeon]
MKWIKHSILFAVVLILLETTVISSQNAVNQIVLVNASAPMLNIDIRYIVQVRDSGTVVINTLVNLLNIGVEPISSLKIGFSKNFEQNINDAIAYETQELEVQRVGVEGDVFWVNVDFARYVENGQSINLSIYFVFSRLITYDQ